MSYKASLKGRNVEDSKENFVSTENLVFDFELFIGGRNQKQRLDYNALLCRGRLAVHIKTGCFRY